MIPIIFLLVLSFVILGIALSGIATDRHFFIIMLAIELILVSSTIVLVTFFSYSQNPDPNAVLMLISIWAVAAVEIITLITFYVYMKHLHVEFDVTKLSRMKW